MVGTREEMKRRTSNKVLALWIRKETKWLTYKEIVKKLKEDGVSERTVARYLRTLVRDDKLLKEERGYKKTFYRPRDEFLHKLHLSYGDWIRIHEEYLTHIGKEIISRFERALAASKETDERITKLICEEIDKISEERTTLTQDEIFENAIYNVLSKEKLQEPDSKILASLVTSFLLNAFCDPFSNPYGCAGTIEPHVLLSNLESEIMLLMESYMNLWSFMYMLPGASFKFENYIKEAFPGIFSLRKKRE